MPRLLPAKLLITILWMAFLPRAASAQEADTFDIVKASIYYPHRVEPKSWNMEIAMSQIKLPFDWLETSIQAPLFQFHANYGLPKGFALDGRFSTLFVSNQLSIGPRWNVQWDKFSVNIGYDVAFTYGFLNQFGFASTATSWINYPNFSVGYRYKDVTFTFKAEASLVTAITMKQGENEIATDRNFGNGYTVGVYMEQRIHKNKVIVLGLKNTYAKYHFIAWPAFSTFNRFYNMPEFYVGLVL